MPTSASCFSQKLLLQVKQRNQALMFSAPCLQIYFKSNSSREQSGFCVCSNPHQTFCSKPCTIPAGVFVSFQHLQPSLEGIPQLRWMQITIWCLFIISCLSYLFPVWHHASDTSSLWFFVLTWNCVGQEGTGDIFVLQRYIYYQCSNSGFKKHPKKTPVGWMLSKYFA